MKVSIVIINHNYAKFLRQAIESALAQTYPNNEVVVIDDGSTDESSTIINSYGSLIKPILKENTGQSSCYALGLAASTGDLLLYLDADDYLHPDCLREVIRSWPRGCTKGHFYLEVVNEHGAPMNAVVPSGRLRAGVHPLKMMRLFGAYCSPPASGNIYNREYLNQIFPLKNEDQLFKGGADSVTIFAAPFYGTITAIPQTLGFYRRHANAAGGVTSAFQTDLSLRKLEREHKQDLLRDFSWRLVVQPDFEPRLTEPSRLKRRLCYLRLANRKLDSQDSRWKLLRQGILATAFWDGYSWSQKLAIAAWFFAVAVLPARMAQRIISPALGITNRQSVLRRFLRAKPTRLFAQ
jgi:glycosyltransferase involved in cell wall biosynthesis